MREPGFPQAPAAAGAHVLREPVRQTEADMEPELQDAIAQYVQEMLGPEGLLYASAIVANCKMLAVDQEDADQEALVMAAYLHDISTGVYGKEEHHRRSAEMAAAFLQEWGVPPERVATVQAAIMVHSFAAPAEER